MFWMIGALVAGVLLTIARLIYFARHHGLDGYGCNRDAYEKQKAIPWWKRKG